MGQRRYQFAGCSLYPATKTLLRNGEIVDLTPKAVETLCVLVENAGTVVSKESLLDQVWPGIFVEEGSLARNICSLRRVFAGDHEDGFIQTVPRRGYRFVGRVEICEEAAEDKRKSLTVLPLRVLEDSQNQDIGIRLADAVVTRLSILKHFRVQPLIADARSRRHYPESDYFLRGTIQKDCARIRVTVQLLDGGRIPATLWAENFEGDCTDIFRMEDSFAEEICGAVGLLLSTQEKKLLSRQYTESKNAYRQYLRGLFYWNQRTEKAVRRAIGYFRKAIYADPRYAPAHSALASSYAFLPMLSPVRSHATMPKAKAAAINALEIDDTLAEARSALAFVQWHYEWNWARAESEFRRILRFVPDHALTHQWYGLLLAELGRFTEAIKEAAIARSLEPSASILSNEVTVLYLAGKYDEALKAAHGTLALFPCTLRAQLMVGLSLEQKDRQEEAIRELELAYRLSRRVPFICGALGHAYAVGGHVNKARLILRNLENLPPRMVDFGSQALIHIGLGNLDCALNLLEKACQEREFHVVLLKADRRFDIVREKKRFRELVRTVGLE